VYEEFRPVETKAVYGVYGVRGGKGVAIEKDVAFGAGNGVCGIIGE